MDHYVFKIDTKEFRSIKINGLINCITLIIRLYIYYIKIKVII